MNNLELHALFQAEEEALEQAFKNHGLVKESVYQKRRTAFPKLMRDVFEFPDDVLCEKLKVHIDAGASVDATPADYGITAFGRCFGDGKMASMRVLLEAGAQTGWTPDQVSLALGGVPEVPQTGKAAPFCFACRVGNLDAAQAYLAKFETGLNKNSDAVIAAVKARATDVVKWHMDLGLIPMLLTTLNWTLLSALSTMMMSPRLRLCLQRVQPLSVHKKKTTHHQLKRPFQMKCGCSL